MTRRATPRWGRRLALSALALLLLGLAASAVVIERVGVMPRALAPYIEKRSSGHNPAIEALGRRARDTLLTLDRGVPVVAPELALTIGAQPRPLGAPRAAGTLVFDSDTLRRAMAAAQAGDVITLMPGTYRFAGRALEAARAGSAAQPITVRAALPGSALLEFASVEGFRVSAPYWRFENLVMRGVCGQDAHCEHAFHVVGAAHHFAAVNNTITDFNAHFKINGAHGKFPDHGLIESNTLTNTRARNTRNPVTPIDVVAASGWTIRANLISDFIKAEGDRVSYGAFAKGAGSDNRFERNLVWCERRLQGLPGQRVGLSLGGGGTGKPYCRDGRCITEQERGILSANLIVGCSDVGIYLSSAAASKVTDNTLLDTAGIDVRFAGSSADLDGNLVDGPIRSRNGGLVRLHDNRSAPLWQAFIGYHPVRGLFVAPQLLDLAWRGAPPQRAGPGASPAGLCRAARSGSLAYGAFDDFAACLAAPASAATSSSKPAS